MGLAPATLGPGAVVLAGAVVNAGARIGPHAIVNTAAVVEHDAEVGAFAHIGPAAALGGGARIGDGAFVGLGARVRDRVDVGHGRAGRHGRRRRPGVRPDGAVVMGVPARIAGEPSMGEPARRLPRAPSLGPSATRWSRSTAATAGSRWRSDADGRLVGVVTDGDVRRALLAGAGMDDPLGSALSRSFVAVADGEDRAGVLELMGARHVGAIPVLDAAGRPVGLHLLDEALRSVAAPNWAS